jgi:tRNA(Ile)-lysidine synthase
MSLPGGMILDSYGEKTYIYSRDRLERLTPLDKAVCLPVPGRLRMECAGVWITAHYGTLGEPGRFPAGNTVLIRKKGLKEPLWVRRRHPGDRFDPLGTGGAKKLKDFLIDRKIPSVRREMLPLIFDDEGDILWVAGIEISNKAALEGYEGEEAVVLRLEIDRRRAREAGLRDSAIENPEEWSQEED